MKRSLLTFTAITALLLPLATPVVAAAQDGARERVERPQRSGRPDREARPQRREPRSEARPSRPQPQRQESAVQRRVEAAQRQLDQARATPQADPRREARPERQERRPQSDVQRRVERAQREMDRTRDNPRYDARRNQSDVQRRVEAAQRQLDRERNRTDAGRRPDARDRDRDRDRDRWDNRRHDSRYANDRRDRYRDFQRRWNEQQWRRQFEMNRRADWWRQDHRFRNWNGVRAGFYFAPGYGYYSVPRSYWNRHWQVGQYLPDVFWRYQVNDYRTYGLGYPPEGTRWVYVDNSIYLIDQYDGYIVQIIRNAWRW